MLIILNKPNKNPNITTRNNHHNIQPAKPTPKKYVYKLHTQSMKPEMVFSHLQQEPHYERTVLTSIQRHTLTNLLGSLSTWYTSGSGCVFSYWWDWEDLYFCLWCCAYNIGILYLKVNLIVWYMGYAGFDVWLVLDVVFVFRLLCRMVMICIWFL